MSRTDQLVSPQQLRAWLLGNEELALLDVSEAKHHAQGHIVAARHVPLSLLELQAPHLLPRLSVRIVLTSSHPDAPSAQLQVQRAAGLLASWGYSDVQILEGGLPAWCESGGILIDGYASLVKAFGEEVRLRHGVPAISPKALAERVQSGQPTTVVDVRTTPEHRYSTLPGALNYPGVEWPLRDISASSAGDHLWAVTCFSRTRGVIGTATLRALYGPDVPAAWVDDGVMAWVVDGDEDLRNAPHPADVLPELPEQQAHERALQLIERYRLPQVDAKTVHAWQADDSRTLLVFDLRPGAVSRPGITAIAGGQLLMHFEVHAVVRNARVVLLDAPHHLRAAVTSFWLHQLGEAKIFIHDGLADDVTLQSSAQITTLAEEGRAQPIAAQALASLLDKQEAVILDVGPSIDYLRAHLPQSLYANASALEIARQVHATATRQGKRLVVTSPDGLQARLVARDVISDSAARPSAEQLPLWLEGGVAGWQAQGLPVESGIAAHAQLTPFLDDWGSIMRVADADRIPVWDRYLKWERGLAPRIKNDPSVRFRFFV